MPRHASCNNTGLELNEKWVNSMYELTIGERIRWRMKTVSDRIFELLKERRMTQKEFAQRTGIAESSISDWKKKRTNPVSDKILIICEVLGVSPYELLSGAEHTGNRSREHETYVISKGTDVGMLVESYQKLDPDLQKRLLGYLEALKE